MRYFIQLSYNGSAYHGWQYQPNAISVQETLTNALQTILREKIEIVGAGRTDAGVHASKMFAHFDTEQLNIEDEIYVKKLNGLLPKDIAIQRIFSVKNDAHARFDATKRTYEYHIHFKKNVFSNQLSWYCHFDLDIELMNNACLILFQYNDFECFSKLHTDVNTFNCDISEAHWAWQNEQLIFTISADRFLRNMVRAIVGTMINIGMKKWAIDYLHTIIKSKNRNNAGFSVPAHGLYLTDIQYPYI